MNTLRQVVRDLLRKPRWTAPVILTLSLGIGATTAVFGVLDALVLAPLPYPNGSRLREVRTVTQKGQRVPGVSGSSFRALRNETTTFSIVEGYQFGAATLTGRGEPALVSSPGITPGLVSALGVRPLVGRLFVEGEQSTALINERVWVTRFSRSNDVIGRRIALDDRVYSIVGVLPASFGFPEQRVDVWRPLVEDSTGRIRGRVQTVVLPRIANSQAVDEQLKAIAERLHRENLLPNDQLLVADDLLQRRYGRENRPALYAMFGAVSLLLLVACVNVTNLLLIRASSRHGEFALLNALGARTSHLVAYTVLEALLLVAAGGVGGVVIAHFLLTTLLIRLPENITLMSTVTTLNWRALLFAFGLGTVVAAGIGVLPALRASRAAAMHLLKARTLGTVDRHDDRWQAALVSAQLALVLALLWGTGLLTRSFTRLINVDPGFQYENLLVFEVQLPESRYGKRGAGVAVFEQLDQYMESRLGGRSTTFSNGVPPRGGGFSFDIQPEAEGEAKIEVVGLELPHSVVASDYFSVMGIPMREGRSFRSEDTDAVVVINEVVARRFWHGRSPVGRRFRLNADQRWHTVIGVAADVKQMGPADPMGEGMEIYFPYSGSTSGAEFFTFIVRAPGNQHAAITQQVKQALWKIDAGLPVLDIATMEQRLFDSVGRERFLLLLSSLFSVVTVLLAGVGVYGTSTYWIMRRRQDFGIRTALGASPRAVMALVFERSLRIAGVGAVGGFLMSIAGGRLISSLLFQTQSGDLMVLVASAGALVGLVLLACAIPAFSLTRINPASVLRAE